MIAMIAFPYVLCLLTAFYEKARQFASIVSWAAVDPQRSRSSQSKGVKVATKLLSLCAVLHIV